MSTPFDPKLAAVYGKLVNAAYSMYAAKCSNPLCPEPCGIPDGYEMSAWIQMSDFLLNVTEPRFYGIIVHSVANPNERIIAIRGTENAMEWVDDGFCLHAPFRQVPSAGRVAAGFDKIYGTMKIVRYRPPAVGLAASAAAPAQTFSGSFADQLDQLAQTREAERGITPSAAHARPLRPTVVTGHSLGSALATLFVMENATKGKFDITTLCTFASPRVGNMEFVHTFNLLAVNSWRVVNARDVVPKLPHSIPVVLEYGHVDNEVSFDSAFAKDNILCWHSMATYLHWVDSSQALSPECVP